MHIVHRYKGSGAFCDCAETIAAPHVKAVDYATFDALPVDKQCPECIEVRDIVVTRGEST